MIIKSMSRKVPSFGQLIGYIDRDEGNEQYTMRHNLMGRDQELMRSEFEMNSDLLQNRKNGVYLYHEIISITRAEGLEAAAQKDRLYDIAQTYIDARCPENMVFGGLHADKDHSYHMHLMISSNRAGDAKRLRLTKAQFREIQIQTERYVLEKYPELEQKVAIEKQSDRGRTKGEAELERRTGKRPKREEVLERVSSAFDLSQDKQTLLDALGRENLELYVRGKTLGVVDHESGKKHRLKTLDLEMADRIAIRMEGSDLVKEPVEPEQEADAEAQRQAKHENQNETQSEFAGEKEKAGERRRRRDDQAKAERRKRRDRKQDAERRADDRKSDRSDVAIDNDNDRKKARTFASQERDGREADNESYVKYGSNTDLKSNPSQQKSQDEQAKQKPGSKDKSRDQSNMRDGTRNSPEAGVSEANAPEADVPEVVGPEQTGSSILGFGKKIVRSAMKATELAMHELEEAGKIIRQGVTGQDEETGKTRAEKDAEQRQNYQDHNPDPHAAAKQAKDQKVDRKKEEDRQRGDAPGREEHEQQSGLQQDQRSDGPAQESSQQQSWRDEINQSRGAGRDDSDRGRD